MSKLISMSEAVSIGLHGMVLLAKQGGKGSINVQDIASATQSSRHHVAKIMQRLAKEGFLLSQRGPTGGFILNKKPSAITLLDIWEAIEGKLVINSCPLDKDKKICSFGNCIMDTIALRISGQFKEYLQNTTLASFLKNAD